MVFPRSHLSQAIERDELKQPSFYMLLGEDQTVYIGETENPSQRIKDHHYKKDFWNEAIVFHARDQSITKADVQFLEYLAIKQARQARLFTLEENKHIPTKPTLPEHQEDSTSEFFEDITMLSSFLGYAVFDIPSYSKKHIFYCNSGQGTDAKAVFAEKNIRVIAGSRLRKIPVPSYRFGEIRKGILSTAAEEHESYYELIKDIEFPTPSAASTFCLGRPSNGWTDWKNKEGKSLDELMRIHD